MNYENLLVLATQRSGSTLFCRDISYAGRLGKPKEYFIPVWRNYSLPFGEDAQLPNPEEIQKAVTKREGFFSVKIMSDQLQSISDASMRRGKMDSVSAIMKPSKYIVNLFNRSLIVRIRRRDKIAQAISRHVVTVRGYNHSFQEAHSKNRKLPVEYDFDKIRKHLTNILEEEAFLDEFLSGLRRQNNVLELLYEDFAYDSERNHVSKVLLLMGKEAGTTIHRDMKKLATQDSEEMRRLFVSEWPQSINHANLK